MKKYLFVLIFFLFLGCKTAQKAYFSSNHTFEKSIQETTNQPVFTSIETLPNAHFELGINLKNKLISIENLPFQANTKLVNLKKRRPNILVKFNKISATNLVTQTLKKPLGHSLRASYIALVFLIISILAMLVVGNVGSYPVVFAAGMMILAIFFGVKGIRKQRINKL